MTAFKIWQKFFLFFIFAFLFSCAATKLELSLDYQHALEGSFKPHEGVPGVDEFIDLRSQAFTSDTKKWLGFIPGV